MGRKKNPEGINVAKKPRQLKKAKKIEIINEKISK